MDILIVRSECGRSSRVSLSRRFALGCILSFLLAVSGGAALAFFLGLQSGQVNADSERLQGQVIREWESTLAQQQADLEDYKIQTQARIDALTRRAGVLQARLLRLDAMGERVTDAAGLDSGEFSFDSEPALGGPAVEGADASYSDHELDQLLDVLERQVASREQQLAILDEIFVEQKLLDEQFIAGQPIRKGWLSSRFGYRQDPFTGKRAWHAGVDFAGEENSPIVAIGGGVVTWAGKRSGYGNLIEISHGNGLSTRYAHCKSLEVRVGQVVSKGDVVARMGSTGRSTGPHVHFEVLKDGRQVDPSRYIARRNR